MTAGTLDLLLQARNGDEAAAAKALEENSGLIWAVRRTTSISWGAWGF